MSKDFVDERSSALTSPTILIGSPNYMSPEAMRSKTKSALRPASDVWSLGAVLYEIVTGERPFAAETVAEICARVIHDEPTPPSQLVAGLAPELEAVISRCLRKDPVDRFASVAELARALAPHGTNGAVELAERSVRIASSISSTRMLPPIIPRAYIHTVPPTSSPSPLTVAAPPEGRRRRALVTLALSLIGALAVMSLPWGELAARRPSVPEAAAPEWHGVAAAEHDRAAVTLHALVSAPSAAATGDDAPPPKPPAAERPPRAKPSAAASASSAPSVLPSTTAAAPDAWDPSAFGGRK